jgi:DNA-binding NarL/FixJ family response regulator
LKILAASLPVTLLVVDDHGIVRDGVRLLLARQSGLQVVGTAATGDAALAGALRHRPDVIVMDLLLGECSGIDIIRQIVEWLPCTRIIVLSASHSAEHVFRALQAGACGYVLKEAAVDELVHAVHAAVAGERYLSSQIASMIVDGLLGSNDGSLLSPIERLSERERQVLHLTIAGSSSSKIGTQLSLSRKTIETYRSRIMEKLHVPDRTQLIHFAIQHALIPKDPLEA